MTRLWRQQSEDILHLLGLDCVAEIVGRSLCLWAAVVDRSCFLKSRPHLLPNLFQQQEWHAHFGTSKSLFLQQQNNKSISQQHAFNSSRAAISGAVENVLGYAHVKDCAFFFLDGIHIPAANGDCSSPTQTLQTLAKVYCHNKYD